MSLVIPPGFAQIVYRSALAGDPEECLWTLGTSMDGYLDGQDAADVTRFGFVSAYSAGFILAGWTFLGTRVYVGQDGGPPTVWESTGPAVVGTNPGPGLPPNCAFLVQKRSALGGRRNRGRMYLPAGFGVGEDSVPITGVMAEAQRADLNTRVTDAFTGAADRVIFHDELTPGGSTPTTITSFIVQARLATVRRRLRP